MDLKLSPDIELAPAVKLLLNIGGTLDIVTGTWSNGKHGESILNGGLGFITGQVGPGNAFKSTLLHGMLLKGMSVVFDSCFKPEGKNQRALKRMRTSNSTYDTEVNMQEPRLKVLSKQIRELFNEDLFNHEQVLWKVTDKTVMWGNEFFEKLKEFTRYKRKNQKAYEVETPFLDRDGSPFKIILPTFGLIDSITDFQTEKESDIQDENELGDSGGNTLFARSGLFKTRLLTELPGVCGGSYHFLGLTAQLNTEMAMGGGGPAGAAQPQRKLHYLGQNQKIVGATTKFTYATTVAFNARSARPLVDADRMAEYPRPEAQKVTRDTDLNEVALTILRNKNGKTGVEVTLLTTQLEGLQFELSEFHNLRENKRYGIIGSGQWYTLALYPECAIQRTTIRKKIAEDLRLRRAINITSEMQQMSVHMPAVWAEYGCEPTELHADLKKMGYDWEMLLTTRGSYRLNNEYHPVPFLSSLDLLKMRKGLYFPYWMTADKKGIKPEYQYTYAEEDYLQLDETLVKEAEILLALENAKREADAKTAKTL